MAKVSKMYYLNNYHQCNEREKRKSWMKRRRAVVRMRIKAKI